MQLDQFASQYVVSGEATLPEARIDRKYIRTQVHDSLQQLAEGRSLACPIINVYGMAGMGKTQLAHQLFSAFESDQAILFLSFDATPQHNLGRLMSWSQVRTALREQVPALEYLPDVITASQDAELAADDVQVIFAMNKVLPSPDRPLLVILDAVDDLWYWKWMQEEFIRPLLEEQGTLLLCASRAPLFWDFWELREQCCLCELELFTLEETTMLLSKLDERLPAKPLYTITQGYPFGLVRLQQILSTNASAEAAETSPAAMRPTNLEPELQEVVRFIGVMRYAEVPVMCKLLEDMRPYRSNHHYSETQLRDICSTLLFRGYLDESLNIPAALQRAATQSLLADDKELYIEVCRKLEMIYYNRLIERPREHIAALNEWLYFSSLLIEHERNADYLNIWQDHLLKAFKAVRYACGGEFLNRLFEDDQVLDRLRHLQLTWFLYAALEQWGEGEVSSISIIVSRADLNQYRHDLTRKLTMQLPQRARELFDAFQAGIVTLKGRFNIAGLFKELNNSPAQAPGYAHHHEINLFVTALCNQGLCSYDQREAQYKLHPVFWSLTANTMLTAALAPMYTSYDERFNSQEDVATPEDIASIDSTQALARDHSDRHTTPARSPHTNDAIPGAGPHPMPRERDLQVGHR